MRLAIKTALIIGGRKGFGAVSDLVAATTGQLVSVCGGFNMR